MKKVGLACTGGGIKSAVNIGILRALDELNIKVEALSGASLGALVSLLYLCGYSPKQILEFYQTDIFKFQKYNFLEILCSIPSFFINGGSKNPKLITDYVQKIEKQNNIRLLKDINIPFVIPALDISAREAIYYSSKPLKGNYKYYTDRTISEAIRSSCAVPLMFTPNKVIIDGKNHFMLDGGILTNTLVRPLKEFSNYVIGVTNKFYPKERKRVNLGTGFTQTFQSMRRAFLSEEKQAADLWIELDEQTNRFVGSKEEIKCYENYGYKAIMEYAKQHYFDKIVEDKKNV